MDPLDGTREFGEPGRTDWAVHVALWERGQLTAGRGGVAGPGPVLSTAEPPPASGVAPGAPLRGCWSAGPGRLEFVHRLAEQLGAELVPLGSAALRRPR